MQISITCKGSKTVPLDDLADFQGNLKELKAEELQKLKRSIKKYGFSFPVFVWEGKILDGHQRLQATRELLKEGFSIGRVPVVEIEARDETEAAEKLLILNSQYARFTEAGLADFLKAKQVDITALCADISIPEFDFDKFLRGYLEAENPGLTDPDEIPDPPEDPVTQPGDLYLLGSHRLLCGDSTSATDVTRLLAGVKPHLMVTDPPYGVEYDPTWRAEAGVNKSKGKMGKVMNDSRADWREAWALFPGEVAYVWHAGLFAREVQESLEACGFHVRSQIIWAKDRFALSRGHYHWQHEPCWYAVKGKGHWSGDRSQSTLWQIKSREDSGVGHGTQKPVSCMLRPIENNSSPGQAVFDPFCGSGTTLIAAEMTGRQCLALELSPAYCDVIVKRWEDFTGQKAAKE